MEGDHIKARRLGLLYTHHGIDMGDGTVVHLAGDKKSGRAAIRRTGMDEFLAGKKLRVVDYARGKVLPAGETVRLALGVLENKPQYNLVFNNCEHFATYCKTGRKKSSQVHRALAAACALGIMIVGAGIRAVNRRT